MASLTVADLIERNKYVPLSYQTQHNSLITSNQGEKLLRTGRPCPISPNCLQLVSRLLPSLFVSQEASLDMNLDCKTKSIKVTCVDPRCEPRDFLGLKPGGKLA
jgi:hypothetical protein